MATDRCPGQGAYDSPTCADKYKDHFAAPISKLKEVTHDKLKVLGFSTAGTRIIPLDHEKDLWGAKYFKKTFGDNAVGLTIPGTLEAMLELKALSTSDSDDHFYTNTNLMITSGGSSGQFALKLDASDNLDGIFDLDDSKVSQVFGAWPPSATSMEGGIASYLSKPMFATGNKDDWVKCEGEDACKSFPENKSYLNNYMQVVTLELAGSTTKWLIGSFLAKAEDGNAALDAKAKHMNYGGANEFKGSQNKIHKLCTFPKKLKKGTGPDAPRGSTVAAELVSNVGELPLAPTEAAFKKCYDSVYKVLSEDPLFVNVGHVIASKIIQEGTAKVYASGNTMPERSMMASVFPADKKLSMELGEDGVPPAIKKLKELYMAKSEAQWSDYLKAEKYGADTFLAATIMGVFYTKCFNKDYMPDVGYSSFEIESNNPDLERDRTVATMELLHEKSLNWAAEAVGLVQRCEGGPQKGFCIDESKFS